MRCDAAHLSLTSMKGRTLALKGSSAVVRSMRMPLPWRSNDPWRQRREDTPVSEASARVKGRPRSSSGNGRGVFIGP